MTNDQDFIFDLLIDTKKASCRNNVDFIGKSRITHFYFNPFTV